MRGRHAAYRVSLMPPTVVGESAASSYPAGVVGLGHRRNQPCHASRQAGWTACGGGGSGADCQGMTWQVGGDIRRRSSTGSSSTNSSPSASGVAILVAQPHSPSMAFQRRCRCQGPQQQQLPFSASQRWPQHWSCLRRTGTGSSRRLQPRRPAPSTSPSPHWPRSPHHAMPRPHHSPVTTTHTH